MAVSKNFVVKNGLEVGTNLIVADHLDLHVGIGTTVPLRTLDVRGDVNFSDGAQTSFFEVSGISTFKNDVNIGVGGSVLHADINKGFIGIGSAIPRYALDVRTGAGATLAAVFDKSISAPGLTAPTLNTDYLVSVASTTGTLYVSGDTHLAGVTTVGTAASVYGTFAIGSLTNNRIPIVGAGSTIEDDANLTFDGSRLAIGKDLSVSGVSTFEQNIVANGNIEGDNSTNIINISRITAAGGQFTGNITPLSGEGIEIFVPTSGVGQVQSYDRANTHWDILRFKGLKIDFHTQVGSGPGAISTERMVLSQGGVLSVGSSFSVNQAGVVTATSFHGEGQIGVGSEGTFIGAGVTMVDFKSSSGNNTVDVKSGIATVTVTTGVSLGLVIALGS